MSYILSNIFLDYIAMPEMPYRTIVRTLMEHNDGVHWSRISIKNTYLYMTITLSQPAYTFGPYRPSSKTPFDDILLVD